VYQGVLLSLIRASVLSIRDSMREIEAAALREDMIDDGKRHG